MPDTLVLDPNDAYRKQYRMRVVPSSKSAYSTFLPGDVVDRAARKRGLSIDEFLDTYVVEFLYNGIEGGFFRFIKKDEKS